ncbi:restriction endonuclease [Candidatus Bathyarchaeota archaeon]|nr:MAG: restriction endonuclease [Candidatus Bathyarchaeota archaeon]
MHTYLSNSEPIPEFVTVRVLVEAVKLGKNNAAVTLSEIAKSAGTTLAFARRILEDHIGNWDEKATMDSSTRFKLSVRAVRLGALQQVARALTWQEFESFTEECLQTTGFYTQKGVIVTDDFRRWQIDVIAKKGRMVLAIDCKHWESPAYESRLRRAGEHQKLALRALLNKMIAKGERENEVLLALPIILTLFEPRARIMDGVVAVSVEQFADLLQGLSPYSSELPFMLPEHEAKSSICQRVDDGPD